jgi:hypothetical protein
MINDLDRAGDDQWPVFPAADDDFFGHDGFSISI